MIIGKSGAGTSNRDGTVWERAKARADRTESLGVAVPKMCSKTH